MNVLPRSFDAEQPDTEFGASDYIFGCRMPEVTFVHRLVDDTKALAQEFPAKVRQQFLVTNIGWVKRVLQCRVPQLCVAVADPQLRLHQGFQCVHGSPHEPLGFES